MCKYALKPRMNQFVVGSGPSSTQLRTPRGDFAEAQLVLAVTPENSVPGTDDIESADKEDEFFLLPPSRVFVAGAKRRRLNDTSALRNDDSPEGENNNEDLDDSLYIPMLDRPMTAVESRRQKLPIRQRPLPCHLLGPDEAQSFSLLPSLSPISAATDCCADGFVTPRRQN
eukprot:CAMPEP_0197439192 /NCGR_PEP_ID=MMETSP1175-20131217/5995_1 /TAXON_ID=1003142 /ORGANISM="Triceratium dubium, Strain CCMP147" /LENGTH=170 /DNA_ID=CAMNT_0042969057 /DNA_START=197 /DNA_END=709 /DNA_ORIENTATION=+